MSEPKLMALLQLSPKAFRELFQLPPGTEVVRIETRPGYRGRVDVIIEGAGWLTDEWAPLRSATAIVTHTFLEDRRELAPVIKWSWDK